MVRGDNVWVFETLLVPVPHWLVVASLSNFRQQSALVKHLEGRHAAVFFFLFQSESPLIITHTHLYTHFCSHTVTLRSSRANGNPYPQPTGGLSLTTYFFLLRWMSLRVPLSLNVFLPLAIFPWTHFYTPFWSFVLEKVNGQQQHSETKAPQFCPFPKKKNLMCVIGHGNTFLE